MTDETKTDAAEEAVTAEAPEALRFVEKDPSSHVSENDTFEGIDAPDMGVVKAPERRTDPTPKVAAYVARKTSDHESAVFGKTGRVQ